MARHTGRRVGDFFVIETGRRYPCRSRMARGAIVRRRDVIYRLSSGLHSVVARKTRSRRGAVIHFRRNDKAVRRMAGIALLRGWNMANGLATGKLAVVAGRALGRKAFKDTVEMARFAPLLGVQPNERESGAKVIEVFVNGLCQCGQRERRSHCRKEKHSG